MTDVVTDTEARMILFNIVFTIKEGENGMDVWTTYQLSTGLASADSPKTLGTLSACHSIVSFFKTTTKLVSKQQNGTAVNPIIDMATRWLSTYSMVKGLIRLKAYSSVQAEEGDLDTDMNED